MNATIEALRAAVGRLPAAVVAAAVVGLIIAGGAFAPGAVAATPAWTTYNHDAQRSAIDPDSTSPLPPAPAWPGPAQLDGQVFAQPLVVGSEVYAATENDTVYALNAATGAVIWRTSVGTPVPAGDLPCGDISPTVGITGTPVIDPAAGRIYAVADSLRGTTVRHLLVALEIATGAPVPGFPVAIDPSGSDPKALLQRTALALDGGRVFAGFGGNNGDCGDYHGWVMGLNEDGSGAPSAFEVDSPAGEHGGAIWGAGDGPAVDAAGHLLYSTGNGFSSSSTPDDQESVVALNPGDLTTAGVWTAGNWQALDSSDQDLGSSEPLPLPGGLLFEIGKDGVGRLLSGSPLGSTSQVFSAQVCRGGGAFGASLYRDGVIYVPCSGGLAAVTLTTSPSPSFAALAGWSAPTGASGPPIFAGGLVWSTGWRGTGLLYGLDPGTGAVHFQQSLGTFNHFATPSAGGGRLFAAVGSTVTALTIATPPPPSGAPPPSGSPPAAGPLPPAGSPSPPHRSHGPRMSHVRVTPRRFNARHGTTLRLTLSRRATVRVQVSATHPGRRSRGRCRSGARHGRRCMVIHHARRFRFTARPGHRSHRLRTRGLPPGRYVLTAAARDSAGRRSPTVTVRFQIVR